MSNEIIDIGFERPAPQPEGASLMQVSEKRAEQEVQAAFVIAKRYPRDEFDCFNRIIRACRRPSLAEEAMYAYPRGGQTVTGESIRLAEALALAWGNIDFGIREISQSNGMSIAEAYAIDLQTNTRSTKIFHVPHVRDTKKGRVKLTDARDIYEIVANQGARRMRNCILALIPGDVREAAKAECKKTLETSDVPMEERIRKMVGLFDDVGVKVEHLEKRLGHKLDATIVHEVVQLQAIYKSLRDGHAKREDFFDIGLPDEKASTDIENLIANKGKKQPSKTEFNPDNGVIKENGQD